MGLAVHVENQIHEREYMGSEPGQWLAGLLREAAPEGQLATVGDYGDTMFNRGQMYRILKELDIIATNSPHLSSEVAGMRSIIDTAIRRRGYLWISGD